MIVPRKVPHSLRALLLALLASAAPAGASGLIDNVNGLTVDESGDLVHFTGLLIDSDGRVEKRLKRGDKRPDRPDFRYDGKGRTLIPGLIDAHGDVMALGFATLNLDLADTGSLDEAKAKIAAYAAANAGRPWIIGRGWDQEAWGLGRFPTAADLAGLAGGRPIWLVAANGDAGWANDAALIAGKITPASKAPAGGRILMAGGKPGGVLVGTAMALMDAALPRPQPKDYDAALLKAQDMLLARGVTAIADIGTSIEAWQAYRRAGDRGALRVRIMGYAAGMEQATLIAGPGPTPWLYDDRLRLGGVALTLDGGLRARAAWLKAAYADAPGDTGLPRLTAAQLRNQMSRAAMDGFQLAVNATGDRANAEVLDAIDELAETYKGDRRWRIDHARIVNPADRPRFGHHGIRAVMAPQQGAADRAMVTARLGPDRLDSADAWRAMLDEKALLAFGSSGPLAPAAPFAGIAAAITRPDEPAQRVKLSDGLRAYGWGAAHAGFAEQRFGNLAPGQRADFLIVDRDIELARPADLPATRIVELWIGGQRVLANVVAEPSGRAGEPDAIGPRN
ncbi:MAG TPA: amidohydrolase [Sphingobium sp.]|nr:amidohydrolase [Sphingobium sp.]